ncbi:WD40-repeat-containing domain protein [Geopyxis carbonaria]|nr:WD40-repeat-containing domain protein [Geopyxis carbonaria]
MPAPDSPTILVARFLQYNGYTKTLAAFLDETNLTEENLEPKDPKNVFTLESVLDEKRIFDLSLKMEQADVSSDVVEFTQPCPSVATDITPPDVTPSNVLFVTIETLTSPIAGPAIIVTTADRALRIYDAKPPHTLLRSFPALTNSAILCVAVLDGSHLLASSMTGTLTIASADTGVVSSSAQPHSKYAIRVVVSPCRTLVASCAYDKTVVVHRLSYPAPDAADAAPSLDATPLGTLTLQSPPEALAFVTMPTGEPALVVSRRDSTFLYYHALTAGLPELSRHNLAPDSNSWISFHAMWLSVSPRDPTLLAVATNAVPNMRLLLVRVGGETVMSVFTAAPQSAYSNAVVGWRPDASGLWVNADDGVVRGVDPRGGKGRAQIRACAGGEKVRTIWAGSVDGVGEVVVTGGFDKGLKVWTVGEGGEGEGEE